METPRGKQVEAPNIAANTPSANRIIFLVYVQVAERFDALPFFREDRGSGCGDGREAASGSCASRAANLPGSAQPCQGAGMSEKHARQPSGALTDPSPPLLFREPSAPVTTGQVIAGRYELRARLGAGAMGVVFRAYDRELEEEVALKALLPWQIGEDRTLARLRSEVKLARRITHRNVCRVFDLGEDGELKFLTMELVQGQPLRELLARGRVEPERAFAILEQIIAGLGAAHAQGVLHRDLKPENVMICREGRVALVDFGLARSFTHELTASGSRAGTPAYMSPEQIRGEPLDARSDVFSLGILAFELLSGEGPFGQRATPQILSAILDAPPVPLVVPGLSSDVVEALEAVLARALAKRPAERFRAIEELGAALAAARRGLSPKGAEIPRERQSTDGLATAAKRRREGRGPVGAVAVLGLCLIAGAALSLASIVDGSSKIEGRAAAAPVDSPRDLAAREDRLTMIVVPFENRTGDPQWDGLAQTATSVVQAELQRERAIHAIEGSPALSSVAAAVPNSTWSLGGALQLAGNQIRVTARIRAPDGSIAGDAINAEGEPDRKRDVLERLRVHAMDEVRLLQRDHERRLRAERGTSNKTAREELLRYYDLIGPGPRIEVLDAAKRLVAGALAADPGYVPALLEQAELLMFEAQATADNQKLSEALSVVEGALAIAPDDPRALLLRCQQMQRNMLNNGYPTDETLSHALTACSAAARALPHSAEMLRIMARFSDLTCQDDLAVTQLKSALEIDRSLSGPVLAHLVALALQNGRLELADEMSQRFVEFSEEEAELGARALSRRAGVPGAIGAHGARAEVLLRRGKLDEAQVHLEKELGYITAGLGNKWVEPKAIRGLFQIATQRKVPPPPWLVRRLSIIEKEYGAATARDPSTAWVLAGAYQFVDPEAALVWIQRLGSPKNYREVLARTLFHHMAGDDAGARRALGELEPAHEWERGCQKWLQSLLSE
ncbi:serine/threonine-protein kinase [Polyangium sp. y55x31]|uniref:serine/threonine-protein kinase n=1 Tax=Polyangium sp. y55x31 TaxID=3042688 RepID=UPI00248248F4|nr:serine/threonine-protein kinase [Polyangium sp. y55x31]MDI1475900.1 protein kinase [Polyangium sp. y55x31]